MNLYLPPWIGSWGNDASYVFFFWPAHPTSSSAQFSGCFFLKHASADRQFHFWVLIIFLQHLCNWVVLFFFFKDMLYRRTCLLIDYEESNKALDKAKPHRKAAVSFSYLISAWYCSSCCSRTSCKDHLYIKSQIIMFILFHACLACFLQYFTLLWRSTLYVHVQQKLSWKTTPLATKMLSVKTDGLWWQVQLYLKCRSFCQ